MIRRAISEHIMEEKLIGAFSDIENAEKAIEQLEDKEDFCKHLLFCFEICENTINQEV